MQPDCAQEGGAGVSLWMNDSLERQPKVPPNENLMNALYEILLYKEPGDDCCSAPGLFFFNFVYT